MAIKSEALIYKIIEEKLKTSESPLTCSDLWDFVEVKKNAKSAEKVSDFLGLMWRRGLIQRWSVPLNSTSKSRFGYTWANTDSTKIEALPSPSEQRLSVVKNTYKKSNVTVTEDGNRLILDFDHFTMTIQSKA
jgi:hypothetical protein